MEIVAAADPLRCSQGDGVCCCQIRVIRSGIVCDRTSCVCVTVGCHKNLRISADQRAQGNVSGCGIADCSVHRRRRCSVGHRDVAVIRRHGHRTGSASAKVTTGVLSDGICGDGKGS